MIEMQDYISTRYCIWRYKGGCTKIISQYKGDIIQYKMCSKHREMSDAGIAQAIRHGHPTWSHEMAYGPCTRKD